MARKEEWQGRVGAEWAKRTKAVDLMLGPAGESALASLDAKQGEYILDVGCGAGASSFALAQEVGTTGKVHAVDISSDLITQAKQCLQDAPVDQLSFELADAAQDALGGPYRAVFSRFGLMFFDEPVAALAHIRNALSPNGRLVAAAWDDVSKNDWASLPVRLCAKYLRSEGLMPAKQPAEPSRFTYAPGPFGWSNQSWSLDCLEKAGFRDVSCEVFEHSVPMEAGGHPDPLERAVFMYLRIGALASMLKNASDHQRATIAGILREGLADNIQDGAVRVAASALIYRANA